jgi:hypothetical protein
MGAKTTTVSRLPDTAAVLTAVGVTLIAVILWTAVSVLRGSMVEPLELVMFAFVFAFLYFSGLYYLGGGGAEEASE